jgi:hypothetical protein
LRLQPSSVASSATRIRPRALSSRRQARSTVRSLETRGERGLDELEPRAPAPGLGQPLLEQGRLSAERLFERHHAARQLVHRHAEDHPGCERAEVDLEAAHLAVVLDNGAAVAEPRDERAEAGRRPAGLDEPQLGSEPEDEDDAGHQRLALSCRPRPCHGIAAEPVDMAAGGKR